MKKAKRNEQDMKPPSDEWIGADDDEWVDDRHTVIA